MEVRKILIRKTSKEDDQTLTEFNSAHCSSQNSQLTKTSYIKQINLFLFSLNNKHLVLSLVSEWEF